MVKSLHTRWSLGEKSRGVVFASYPWLSRELSFDRREIGEPLGASGRLYSRRRIDDYTDRSGPLRVLWPSSRHLAPKLRVFVDFLVDSCPRRRRRIRQRRRQPDKLLSRIDLHPSEARVRVLFEVLCHFGFAHGDPRRPRRGSPMSARGPIATEATPPMSHHVRNSLEVDHGVKR
jgi:hypothetical protein